MGQGYLIDTNVVCDYFMAALPASGRAFMNQIIPSVPNISIVTQIELLSWDIDQSSEQIIQHFILHSKIFDLSPEIVSRCATIRKARKLKMPDAIIAATALVNNLTLVTRNIIDFRKVDGLDVLNPWEI